MASTTFTAPRCRILHNGKIVGKGTQVSYTVNREFADIEVIDNYEIDEFAPVAYRVNGSIALVGAVGTTVKTLGFIPATGKTADEHLLNVLLHDESVLVLMDKKESRNIATLYGVVFDSHGFSLSARGVAGVNVSFKAKRETDESEAST